MPPRELNHKIQRKFIIGTGQKNDRVVRTDPNSKSNKSLGDKYKQESKLFKDNSAELKSFDKSFFDFIRNEALRKNTNLSLAISEIRKAIKTRTIFRTWELKLFIPRLMESTGLSKDKLHELIVEEMLLTPDLKFRPAEYEVTEFISTNLDLKSKFEDVALALRVIRQLPKLTQEQINTYLRELAKEVHLDYIFVLKLYFANILKRSSKKE